MTNVEIDPQEFAPTVRRTTYRGAIAWEIDIRKWPEVSAMLRVPKRKRFTTKTDAQTYYRRLIVAAAAGASLDPVQLPVRAFFDRYQIWTEKKSRSTSTHKLYRQSCDYLLAYLDAIGVHDVADISRATVQGFIEASTGPYAPTTITTTMSVIRAAFNWGIRAGLIADNPVAGMVPTSKAPERRALTTQERSAVMGAEGDWADYWRLYLLTGMRRAELAELTIDRVHIDTPKPFVAVLGKGLKKRDLPLVGKTLDIFARVVRRARSNSTLMVCSVTGGALAHRWRQDRDRLELSGELTLHYLRHDFISTLANSGTPLPVVQRLAGHKNLSTTARYIHDDPTALRAAMGDRSDGV